MKLYIVACVMVVSLMIAIGCESDRGGGMREGEGFKIAVPNFDLKVVQGETQSVTVSIVRDKFFKRDVALEIRASNGISVDPTAFTVYASAVPEVHLRVRAARDAAIGEYRIYLKGTPESGEPTSTSFAVKVVTP